MKYNNSQQHVISLLTLLKLIRIEGLDEKLCVYVKDNNLAKRHKKNNDMMEDVRISYLWSHIGLYMMHIGYDVTCTTD